MDLSKSDEAELEKAIELQKVDKDDESLSLLQDLHARNPENYKVSGMLGLVLGGKFEKRDQAIPYLEYAVSNSNYELFHLALYIAYAKTEVYDKAFSTLFNYLKKNPATLFKDTLEELLEGLTKGFGTNYKDEIIEFSKQNDVPIPDVLS